MDPDPILEEKEMKQLDPDPTFEVHRIDRFKDFFFLTIIDQTFWNTWNIPIFVFSFFNEYWEN